MIKTLRNLLKKPALFAGNADWISELSAGVDKNNNIIHHSIKKLLIKLVKNQMKNSL